MPEKQSEEVVIHRLNSIDETLERITKGIERLVLVEERQAQMHSAIERSFKAIEGLDGRVVDIEKRLPDVTRTAVWVDRALWAVAAAAAMFVAKKTGLL